MLKDIENVERRIFQIFGMIDVKLTVSFFLPSNQMFTISVIAAIEDLICEIFKSRNQQSTLHQILWIFLLALLFLYVSSVL